MTSVWILQARNHPFRYFKALWSIPDNIFRYLTLEKSTRPRARIGLRYLSSSPLPNHAWAEIFQSWGQLKFPSIVLLLLLHVLNNRKLSNLLLNYALFSTPYGGVMHKMKRSMVQTASYDMPIAMECKMATSTTRVQEQPMSTEFVIDRPTNVPSSNEATKVFTLKCI